MVLVFDWALQLHYQGWPLLVRARWPIATLTLLLLSAVEFALTLSSESRFAPFLRMGLYVAADAVRPLRRQLALFGHILQRFALLAVLTAFLLGCFTWLGMVAFAGTDQTRAAQPDGGIFAWAFSSLPTTAWSLFVLMTTSNSPDVIMPAYNGSRWAALYFVLFVSVGIFFVSNFLLSIVYHEYTTAREQQALEHAALRAGHLRSAFELLAVDRVRDGLRVVEKAALLAIFRELNSYRGIAYISANKAALLHAMLDTSGDSLVALDDFCRLCELLLIEFVRVDPSGAASTRAARLRDELVDTARFQQAIDAALVLNMVLLAATTRAVITGVSDPSVPALADPAGRMPGWRPLFFVTTALFAAEMALKLLVRPWRAFWNASVLNRFDLGVTLGMVGCAIALVLPASSCAINPAELVRLSILLQSARSWEPIRHVRQFGIVCDIFGRTLPIAAEMSHVLFVCLYLFSAVGLACFGGLVTTDRSAPNWAKLAATDYGGAGTTMGNWANNFNDMSSGIILLFEALVVNNWFEFADGFAAVTSGAYAHWFFVAYYVFSVIIVFNVVTSIVLDVFLAQYTTNGERQALTVDGEAVIIEDRARFDATSITGTATGLEGQYEASVPRAFSSWASDDGDRSASDVLVTAFTRSEETGKVVQVRARAPSLGKLAAAGTRAPPRAATLTLPGMEGGEHSCANRRRRGSSATEPAAGEARLTLAESAVHPARQSAAAAGHGGGGRCSDAAQTQGAAARLPPPPPPSLPTPPPIALLAADHR